MGPKTVKEMNISELRKLKIRLNNKKYSGEWNEACRLQLQSVQLQLKTLGFLSAK